ncbi:MAG: ankyrin repeat domain-containing protein [Bryobacterales bacterium]|nr:ankyrin repeat domain-containing protein [Bryobacterales bacterium]
MKRCKVVHVWLGCCLSAGVLAAQTAERVDFGKDVHPIFRQNCVPCHGPAQQINGLRLDRKSSALKERRIVPGNAENSILLHKLTGTEFGPQMPPTGALRAEQISVIRKWIEQGAEWPDSLSNEVELPPVNPKAVALVEALRTGDLESFLKQVAADPKLLNARGPEGSTPFMYAVLYADGATLKRLLKQGADVNRRNDAGATALMWAATDLEKTRLLLDGGADVNARSEQLRTPLMIAARRPGGAAIVKLLLDRGAKVNPNAIPPSESSPLMEAATAGELPTLKLLVERGADVKASGPPVLVLAVASGCGQCLELLAAKMEDRAVFTGALPDTAGLGDLRAVKLMLDRGAEVNAFDPLGRTALMYAAGSDLAPVEVVKLLMERGADVNAKDRHERGGDSGLTVLDIAKLRGDTPVVRMLVKAGAKASAPAPVVLRPRLENTVTRAVEGSLPLLQKADANFIPKAGCISCHNDSLAAMMMGAARKNGFRVDEQLAAQQLKANAGVVEKMRDRLHQGFFVPVGDVFGSGVLGYILMGLGAEQYPADLNTDAVAMYLKMRQSPDGHWAYPITDTRPPICSDYIGQTVRAMRALQLYAPKVDRAGYEKSIELAANWIANAPAMTYEDYAWRVMGLAWAGKDKAAVQKAVAALLALQRTDGGWSDLETMGSNAYATGKALVALQTAGLAVTDAAYQRGVRYLLRTQEQDGSWYVKSRALTFQPYFDAGFPHGFDQWISAAGTNWATMALAMAERNTTAAEVR